MARPLITVDTALVVRQAEPRVIGINTNFLTDHEAIRAAGEGYEHALRQMGVASLRYPGGEKSDEYFWSVPPWQWSQPALALTGAKGRLASVTEYVLDGHRFRHKPLDFDEFMSISRHLGAEPVICVNFDSMYLPPVSDRGTAPSRDQLLEHAVEWVRYANVRQGYGIRYWELGNESYLEGGNGTARAADYARDWLTFARAMKQIDPTIWVGANGPGKKNGRSHADGEEGPLWWQTLLEQIGSQIDFCAVHPYPCWQWGTYDHYIEHEPVLTAAIDEVAAALAAWASPQDAARIQILATEVNAADWAASSHYPDLEGWPLINDLGHALVLFDILGQHLLHPRVAMAQVWNTRWIHPTQKELWNTLDERNAFNATGYAVAIWGQYLQTNMVAAVGINSVRAFASHDPETGALAVFLINKEVNEREADLELRNYAPAWAGLWSMLSGKGPEDQSPRFNQVQHLTGKGEYLRFRLAPVSISVIELRPA